MNPTKRLISSQEQVSDAAIEITLAVLAWARRHRDVWEAAYCCDRIDPACHLSQVQGFLLDLQDDEEPGTWTKRMARTDELLTKEMKAYIHD